MNINRASWTVALAFSAVGASYAQTIVFSGVGASSMWAVFESGAVTVAGVNRATNAYRASNAGVVVDRDQNNNEVRDTGNLWVIWNNESPRKIWFYVSTDSGTGVRAFFNRARFAFPTNGLPAPDSGYAVPPAEVQTAMTNVTFNTGLSDITPADAKVAFRRIFGLGYSTNNPIRGFGRTGAPSSITPVDFNINGRTFETFNIGASPQVVFVNKTDTSQGGFGDPSFDNINRFSVAGYFNGSLRRTNDAMSLAVDGKPAVVWQRECPSGTYNVFEWCIPQSVLSSQEDGVLSTGAGENPLNEVVPAYDWNNPNDSNRTRGGRVRGIGTSAIVNGVNRTTNAIGYSFWSTDNFVSATNTRYVMVDGVDPLLDTYVDGTYPSGGSVTFKNVRNGSYAIWSLLRTFVDPNPSQDLQTLFATVTGSSNGGNFVPKDQLLVFRSHRATQDFPSPQNGNRQGTQPVGADAGGAVFPIRADLNFFNDTGKELVNLRLGQQQKLPNAKSASF